MDLVTKRLLTIAKRNFNSEKWHNSNGLHLNKIKTSFLVALAIFQMFNRQMWLLTIKCSDIEHLQPHQYFVGNMATDYQTFRYWTFTNTPIFCWKVANLDSHSQIWADNYKQQTFQEPNNMEEIHQTQTENLLRKHISHRKKWKCNLNSQSISIRLDS